MIPPISFLRVLFLFLVLSILLAWVWLIAGRTHSPEEYLRRMRVLTGLFIAIILTGVVTLAYLVGRWLAGGG